MKDRQTDDRPQAVPTRAIGGGEVRARWAWTEPRVWTERMLTALEEGVKGGKWDRLMDKVATEPNLRAAFRQVKANKGAAGVDHQTIAMVERHLDTTLEGLAAQRQAETYQPQAVRRHWIPKPGKPNEQRPLGIPTVGDRVVQAALGNVIGPIFERAFAAES